MNISAKTLNHTTSVNTENDDVDDYNNYLWKKTL